MFGTGDILEQFRKKSLEIAKKRGVSSLRISHYWEDTGSETGANVKRNKEIISKIFFKQRLIHNIDPSTEIELFGVKIKTPIMIAPMRMMETFIEEGIPKMAAASKKIGTILWMGAPLPRGNIKDYINLAPMVNIHKPLKDRDKLLSQLLEAEECGCLGVGVDIDSSGGLKPAYMRVDRSKLLWKTLSEKELKALRKEINIPFIVKGILSVSDAMSALNAGVDAIVVSNHGGSNIDYSQAPFEVLPKIIKALNGKIEVLVDSQIRRGTDVLKALALGTQAVLIGHPIVWAIFAYGTEGIISLIETMTEDLKRTMLYTGVASVNNVQRDILVLPKEFY